MIKRFFDCALSMALLAVIAPLIIIGALGIKRASPGPVFYRAVRVGKGGAPFYMLKLRTMHVRVPRDSVLTAPGDSRVFRWGWFLRNSKIDELPQLVNILKGDMSFVGPRPEDPKIVEQHYEPWMKDSLRMRPGATSPGTLFVYAFSERILDIDDIEGSYMRDLLPRRIERDLAYQKSAGIFTDIGVIMQTVLLILIKVVQLPAKWVVRDFK